MINRKDDGSFVQELPSSMWVFTVPEGHKFPSVIGAYSIDGMTEYNIDSTSTSNGVLTIQFGIDQYTGVLKYSYESDRGSTTIDSGEGGVVNVTVNQYCGSKEPQ